MLELKLEDFNLEEIVSITENNEEETYDITLENHHLFFANDIYTHNSGINSEIVTLDSISEAFNKCFVADFIFTLSRTINDRAANQGRFYIAKNRNGPDGLVFPLFMDTSTATIKVLSQSEETATELLESATKRQEDALKSKYKDFKKEKKAS